MKPRSAIATWVYLLVRIDLAYFRGEALNPHSAFRIPHSEGFGIDRTGHRNIM